MKKYEIEINRNNVTPAEFLAYVRRQLKDKGLRDISSDLDIDYFRAGNDLNFEYRNDPEKPCKAEKSVSKPYETQTYVLNWDGTEYNEICEFSFTDEKRGCGYYYLCNVTDEDASETAEAYQPEDGYNEYTGLYKSRYYAEKAATSAEVVVKVDGGYKVMDAARYNVWRMQK